jgi:Na+/melibiose symporter and related transporters
MASSDTPRGEGFFTLLRKRHFLLLWLAQLISMTALYAANFALIILINDKTGSIFAIALALVAFSLPAALFGGPAGVFVDRRSKRRVLFYSNCLRGIATFGFVVSLLIDSIQLLPIYLLTFLISGIGQFFGPAEGATIPMLVSNEELMHALSLFQVTFMLANALGFILLGPLLFLIPPFHILGLAVTRVESLYFILTVLYLVSASLIALIPAESFVEPRRHKTTTMELSAESLSVLQHVWQEMRQAWTFIRRRPRLFEAVIQLSFAGVLFSVIGLLAAPLVTKLLHLPATSMGFVFAPAGVGLVLSSLFMPRITRSLGKRRAIFLGCMGLAMMVVLLPLSTLLAQHLVQQGMQVQSLHVGVVGLVMFLAGIGLNFINIPASTAMQEQTPEWIKGRILALQLALFNAASIPVLLLIGAMADRFQLPPMLYFLAIWVAGFAIWGAYYERKPHPREHEAKEMDELENELVADKVGS